MLAQYVKDAAETIGIVIATIGGFKGVAWTREKISNRKSGDGEDPKNNRPPGYPPPHKVMTIDTHNNICADRLKTIEQSIVRIEKSQETTQNHIFDMLKNGRK